MAFVPGTLNKYVYNFAGGPITIYAPNKELVDVLLHYQNLAVEDSGSRNHTTAKTVHATLGALTSITLP